ncbi:MAG: hypothetical protein AUG09_03360 [Acidobacteria bacterium 13_1_20CM_2_68_7]|nr:MAG: hypothetical protein AUG09_03360 [Acidobacteria bacterium 13_1_20CM_2_68_7]
MSRHQDEIELNLKHWERKPVLRRVYRDFHEAIATCVSRDIKGHLVEIGSGIGSIREVLPGCVRTDLFPNPWIDRVENAYALSFEDETVSHLILFDVFHHLKYPGTVLHEFRRVLVKNGRLIILDPYIGLLGLLVWGLAHPEPVSLLRPIEWLAPEGWVRDAGEYYAAQGNATRLFGRSKYAAWLRDWEVIERRRMAALSYVASGGYSGPQLYPDKWLPWMKRLDRVLDDCPLLFGTRLLVVMRKEEAERSPQRP